MFASQRFHAVLATTLAVGLESAAIVGLTALGAQRGFALPLDHLDEWLRVTPPADALAAALRWVALAGAWWLLGGTLLYVAAVAARAPAAVRAVRWTALPMVRRVVDAAFAVTVVAGAALAPATAAHAAAPPATTAAVRDGHGARIAALPPAPGPAASPTPVTPVTPGGTTVPAELAVTVAPGDNLWELAARRLADGSGRPRAAVPDAEIAPYWATVCDRNRAALASGDPSLVFPGELVVLPPVPVHLS